MKILFLCVANSARSQIAEGLAKEILGPEHEVHSAGSEPSGRVHESAVQVMKEIEIDISHQTSKFYDDLPAKFLVNLDYVITLCAEEICPTIVSKAQKISWAMADPAAAPETEKLDAFRTVRDEIREKLIDFKRIIS